MVSLITNEDSARIGDIFSTQVLNNMTNLKSGLSPLIECPCRSSMKCFGQPVEPHHGHEEDHCGLLADDYHDYLELINTRELNIFVAATESQKELNSHLLSSPLEGITTPLHRGQLRQAVGFPNSWLEIHTSMFDFQLPVRNPTASW